MPKKVIQSMQRLDPTKRINTIEVDGELWAVVLDPEVVAAAARKGGDVPLATSPFDDPGTIIQVRELPEKTSKKRTTPTPPTLELGEKIKAARLESNLPRAVFAKQANVVSSHLASLETGQFQMITPKVLGALQAWDVALPNFDSPMWTPEALEIAKAGVQATKTPATNGKITIKSLTRQINTLLADHTNLEAAELYGVSDSCIKNWRTGNFEYIGPRLKEAIEALGITPPPEDHPLWIKPSLR